MSMRNVDQVTRRRITKTGLTANNDRRACPGYVLYAPANGPGDVYLIDEQGEAVHTWHMPYPPGLYGYLLPNGHLFYLGKIRDPQWDRFPAWKRFNGGVMMEVDWEGNVLWEHRNPDHHHDGRRTEAGGAIYLTVEPMEGSLAEKVRGGVPGSDKQGMWTDVIVEVDSKGNRVWEWHSAEHLDFEVDVLEPNMLRDEWGHGNTVVPLPNNQVLVSFRNVSTVMLIDKKTGQALWKVGRETLSQQHDPNILRNGNLLVFDNGTAHRDAFLPYSRVVEINVRSDQVVWEYKDRTPIHFFSPLISGARRLPNGNTLVTEGNFGRIFQVTKEGDVVWEYINPHYYPDPDGTVLNSVFRATHYTYEEIPGLW
jgi:hypothetical protein